MCVGVGVVATTGEADPVDAVRGVRTDVGAVRREALGVAVDGDHAGLAHDHPQVTEQLVVVKVLYSPDAEHLTTSRFSQSLVSVSI